MCYPHESSEDLDTSSVVGDTSSEDIDVSSAAGGANSSDGDNESCDAACEYTEAEIKTSSEGKDDTTGKNTNTRPKSLIAVLRLPLA